MGVKIVHPAAPKVEELCPGLVTIIIPIKYTSFRRQMQDAATTLVTVHLGMKRLMRIRT